MEATDNIQLEPVERADFPDFRRRLQEAFMVAVVEKFGPCDSGPIPSDEDVQKSFDAPDARAYHVIREGRRVGGVVVSIHEETQRNSLDFFFISPDCHSRGLGFATWKAVERLFPDTRVWETATPYFEERNIHFYVNKCRFHIVEYYNPHHPDPHAPAEEDPYPDGGGFFRFEKVMKR